MKFIWLSVLLFFSCIPFTMAKHPLHRQLDTICRKYNAQIGIAIRFDNEETVTLNDSIPYAMLSTFKFPLAIAVLDKLDKQQLPLDTEIQVTKADLLPDTYSPLRDARPEGDFPISVSKLIKYAVALSDNNACDILIRYIGGTTALQNYLTHIGLSGMTITATEEMMHRTDNPYLNRTYPSSALELLEKFTGKKLLSAPSQDFLEKTMLETSTGTDKLKGLLPPGTPVGHKTGSSDRNAQGLKAADNDMGFVFLPDGRQFIIAVFVMNSMEDDRTNASIIAQIAKAAYDYYN